jgi:hypothetical protein
MKFSTRWLVCLFGLLIQIVPFLEAEKFTWEDQEWSSPQEKEFWFAIPDWGICKSELYKFRYDPKGLRINQSQEAGYSGFARGYFYEEGDGFYRLVVRVDDGWIKMTRISNPSGNNHNLRSYEKGVLSGRYIDWHPNGERWRDGNAKGGEKVGLWAEWYENGVKKEEGVWEKGKPEGIFEEWYENGQKATEQIFKNGKLTFGLVWKPNGEKCKKSRVTQEAGVLLSYNLEGEIVEERIIKYGKRVAH